MKKIKKELSATTKVKKKINTVVNKEMFVVGIGASAGGLDALQEFFEHIPVNTGMSFCVVQHLSPNFKSLMNELLSKYSRMTISTVKDGEIIKPNHIYLNPNNASIKVENNSFKYVPKESRTVLNLPIDMFFHSLAKEYQDKAIGVILSGTGTDGSRGIRTLKEVGGTIMVQSPLSAQFDGMPNTAISTGLAEYIGTPTELAVELTKFPNKPSFIREVDGGSVTEVETIFNDILDLLFKFSGHRFKDYKNNTLVRRLEKRMGILNFSKISEYYSFLQQDDKEKQLLINDFFIGVTSFFRDKEAFNLIKTEIIPKIFKNKEPHETIRVWSAACSTGEEAYSLAILMDEYILENKLLNEYKIFATDADIRAIEIASNGEFILNSANDIPSNYIEKYFFRNGDNYLINKKIREKIVFSKHNLIADPPFIKMDLISCRNILIYLSTKAQQKTLQHFKFSLNLDGYLFLGSSETLGEIQTDFATISAKYKVYNIVNKSRTITDFTFDNNMRKIESKRSRLHISSLVSSKRVDNESVFTQHLVNIFSPKCIFIDKDYNILYVKGDLKEILHISQGVAQLNLMKMLDDKLAAMVRNGVRRINEENKKVMFSDIKNLLDDKTKALNLVFSKVETSNNSEIYLIVINEAESIESFTNDAIKYNQFELDEFSKQRIEDLEYELKTKNAELQYIVEELETSNEELQASNEELMASNEELQGTNEELQSVNEELYTVNTELQFKNKELTIASDDINNLLKSTEIGTLFLDDKLKIRKITPHIKKHFDLEDSDIGRYIGSFKHILPTYDEQNFIDELKRTIIKNEKTEVKVKDIEGNTYLKRLIPYINSNNKVDGVVINYVDITNLTKAEEELREISNDYKNLSSELELIINNIPALVFYKDDKNNYVRVNNALAEVHGSKTEDLVGKNLTELLSAEEALEYWEEDLEIIKSGKSKRNIFQSIANNGKRQFLSTNKILIKNNNKNYILGISSDITLLRKNQDELLLTLEKLKISNNELSQFAYVASHDLQEPLNTIIGFISLLHKEFNEAENKKASQYINIALEATERMKSLIKGVLEYSRIGKDKVVSTINVRAILQEVLIDLDNLIKEKKAVINIGSLPEQIKGYKTEIRILLQNLISNGLKFVEEGKTPSIDITGEETKESYNFSIKDSGIGIEEKHTVEIFEIFKRLHSNKDYNGTGIGLAHCKKIIDIHNGTINVISTPNLGSSFNFSISKTID